MAGADPLLLDVAGEAAKAGISPHRLAFLALRVERRLLPLLVDAGGRRQGEAALTQRLGQGREGDGLLPLNGKVAVVAGDRPRHELEAVYAHDPSFRFTAILAVASSRTVAPRRPDPLLPAFLTTRSVRQ